MKKQMKKFKPVIIRILSPIEQVYAIQAQLQKDLETNVVGDMIGADMEYLRAGMAEKRFVSGGI